MRRENLADPSKRIEELIDSFPDLPLDYIGPDDGSPTVNNNTDRMQVIRHPSGGVEIPGTGMIV